MSLLTQKEGEEEKTTKVISAIKKQTHDNQQHADITLL